MINESPKNEAQLYLVILALLPVLDGELTLFNCGTEFKELNTLGKEKGLSQGSGLSGENAILSPKSKNRSNWLKND